MLLCGMSDPSSSSLCYSLSCRSWASWGLLPNRGMGWKQADGSLLNSSSCAKLLSDINVFPDSVYYPSCAHYKLITMDISVKIPVAVKLCLCMVKLYLSHQILPFISESFQLIYNAGLFIKTGNGPGLQGT